jgi:hypothetical protein
MADFLQPAGLVKWTKQSVFGLLVHTTIYTLLTAIILTGYGSRWWLWLIILSFSHFVLDHFKYLLNTKFSLWGFYIFVLDQILHIGVMALIAFRGNPPWMKPSPFLSFISSYWKFFPYVIGYITGTFAASILVFEAGRTFAPQPQNNQNHTVTTFKQRFPGIIERTFAISFILAHLYYLVPLSFIASIYYLAKRWGTSLRKKLLVELITSMLSAITIGFLIIFL